MSLHFVVVLHRKLDDNLFTKKKGGSDFVVALIQALQNICESTEYIVQEEQQWVSYVLNMVDFELRMSESYTTASLSKKKKKSF